MYINKLLSEFGSDLVLISFLFILAIGIINKYIYVDIIKKNKFISIIGCIAFIIVIIFLIYNEIYENDCFFIKNIGYIIGCAMGCIVILGILAFIMEYIFKKVKPIIINNTKKYWLQIKNIFKKSKDYLFKLPYPLPEAIIIFFVFKILNFTYYKIIKHFIKYIINEWF